MPGAPVFAMDVFIAGKRSMPALAGAPLVALDAISAGGNRFIEVNQHPFPQLYCGSDKIGK